MAYQNNKEKNITVKVPDTADDSWPVITEHVKSLLQTIQYTTIETVSPG